MDRLINKHLRPYTTPLPNWFVPFDLHLTLLPSLRVRSYPHLAEEIYPARDGLGFIIIAVSLQKVLSKNCVFTSNFDMNYFTDLYEHHFYS